MIQHYTRKVETIIDQYSKSILCVYVLVPYLKCLQSYVPFLNVIVIEFVHTAVTYWDIHLYCVYTEVNETNRLKDETRLPHGFERQVRGCVPTGRDVKRADLQCDASAESRPRSTIMGIKAQINRSNIICV